MKPPANTKYARLRARQQCQRCYAFSLRAYCPACTQIRKEKSILRPLNQHPSPI